MRSHHTRVLMLGWEYPPRFAGGLGKACQGLAQGMSRGGAQIFFVLPTFPSRLSEHRLEVVGAREVMMEAGWELERDGGASLGAGTGDRIARAASRWRAMASGAGALADGTEGFYDFANVTFLRAEAELHPYGAAPEGDVPERIRKFFEEGGHGAVPTTEDLQRVRAIMGHKVFRQFTRESQFKQIYGQTAGDKADASAMSREAVRDEVKRGGEIYGKNLWSEIERFTSTVRHMAEGHEVDVVHAHDWMTFPAAFEFSRLTGVPVFVHVHATEYDRSGENLNNDVFRIEREAFRRATHIFAVSRYTAGVIERLYGVSRKKISVIYNAPDEAQRTFAEGADVPAQDRKSQVIFLGRLTFQKGPDHFLRAAAMVSKRNKDARFILCGTGDMMDQLRGMAHQLGIEDRVTFAGFVDPSAVDEILVNSKVLVMPSVSEPFGLVALEAIRCGMPIIISKQSGVREVLHRALQVDFWDHEKLADQMLAALRLPELSRQLVDEGMDQIQQLSWEKSAHKVIDVYQRYLGTTYAQAIGGAHGH